MIFEVVTGADFAGWRRRTWTNVYGAGEEALTLIFTNLHEFAPGQRIRICKRQRGNEVDWTCKSECRTRKPEAKHCAQKRTGVVYKRKRRQRRGAGFANSECRNTKSDPLRRRNSAARGDPNTEVRYLTRNPGGFSCRSRPDARHGCKSLW